MCVGTVFLATVTSKKEVDYGNADNICPVATVALSRERAQQKIYDYLADMFPNVEYDDWDIHGLRESNQPIPVDMIIGFLLNAGFIIIE